MEAVQQVLAAKWAVDVINNQSLPNELKIGLEIHDTCSSPSLEQAQLFQLISAVQGKQGQGRPKLIGLIGSVPPSSLLTASAALNAFHVPVVAVSPGFYSSVGGRHRHNILTTAPDLAGQARALVALGSEAGAARIALIGSSQATVASFLSESTTLGIRVPEILELIPRQVNIGPAVEGFLRSLHQPRPVVAMLLDAADVVAVAEHLKHTELEQKPIWLIGTLGLELRRLKSWRSVYRGGAFVEPHMPELREFKNFFLASLKSPGPGLSALSKEYMMENTGCVAGTFHTNQGGIQCNKIQRQEMELRFQQDPQVSFVVKAVSALTAAFRLVQLDTCGQEVEEDCLRQLSPGLHDEILSNLHKLSFTSMGAQDSGSSLQGTKHHFTPGGRLVANKQIVYTILEETGLQPVGWYSEDEGLNISPSKNPLQNPLQKPLPTTTERVTAPRSSPLIRGGDRSSFSRSIGEELLEQEQDQEAEVEEREKLAAVMTSVTYDTFIGRTWALVIVSLVLFGVCLSLWMLVYVFLKMCDGTLSGNQSMGVLLLLGVILMFGSAVPWVLPPSHSICAVRHFLHPLAFCLCFGLLLIKVMQLRSLISVGLGGTIPQVNQLLSLFFIIMVQVVITTEWYVINMPLKIKLTEGYPECDVTEETFLLLHVYPCLLLLLTLLYGLAVFSIKRNFNEGRWVTAATVCIIPVFVGWGLVYYLAPPSLHDPSVAVAIVTIAGILMATIFIPKMHTISQQSKYRKLKLHSPGSDSTVYTSYTGQDYPSYNMYYPPTAGLYPGPQGHGYPGHRPHPLGPHLRPHPSHPRLPPHLSRFNGLNYLANPFHPSTTTTYADWSREHTPGYQQYQQAQQQWKKMVSINPTPHHTNSSSRPSRSPEDTLLLSSSRRSSKQPSPNEHIRRGKSNSAKKSALKTGHQHHPQHQQQQHNQHHQQQHQQQQHNQQHQQQIHHQHPPPDQQLLLTAGSLPNPHYDKNSRVYHLTP